MMRHPVNQPLRRIAIALYLVLAGIIGQAQQQLPAGMPAHTWEIYVQQDIDASGMDRLLFVDMLTGLISTTEVHGERYTPLVDRLLYFNPRTQQVMLANTDGTVEPHPFMQLTNEARRVDWLLAADARLLAWTLTYDDPNGLRTITQIANISGTERETVLEDGPRTDGVRALPVAFTLDNGLIMDAHPDGLSQFTPYTQYAGLFRVDLQTSAIALLPDEPACFCGAGLRAGQFLRLTLNDAFTGFDVRVQDLQGEMRRIIPAIALPNYTQAGDILISPDGARAVYALSQIDNFGAQNQTVQTVFMLVNLVEMTQRQLTDPITTYVHPVRWTEDNTAILFTSPQRDGTWKINLTDAQLTRVADGTYIGTLSN